MPEIPEKELSELQQPLSNTQFHEGSDMGGSIVWGEWRPEAWSLQPHAVPSTPSRSYPNSDADFSHYYSSNANSDPDFSNYFSSNGAIGIHASILDVLAVLLTAYTNGWLGSPEQLQHLLALMQTAQQLLAALERECLQRGASQDSGESSTGSGQGYAA